MEMWKSASDVYILSKDKLTVTSRLVLIAFHPKLFRPDSFALSIMNITYKYISNDFKHLTVI